VELPRAKKASKQKQKDIEDLQVTSTSSHNTLKFHGIPEDMDALTDKIVCKLAQTLQAPSAGMCLPLYAFNFTCLLPSSGLGSMLSKSLLVKIVAWEAVSMWNLTQV